MRSRSAAFIAASILCGAAASLPAAARAQAPAVASSAGTLSVTLADAVQRALERNPSAQIAADELGRSRALLVEARAASLPTLAANGTYTRLDAARELNGRVIVGQDSENANAVLAVPLFAPGRWRNWGHAEDGVLVAGASRDEVRRQVALATGRAWLAVAASRRLLDVDRRARTVAAAHVDYASTRFHGGMGNKVDWVRAQTALANADTLVASAQVGLVRAQEALGVLLGAEGPVDANGAEVPAPPPLADALRGAMERRADVRAFELRRKLAHSVAHDAWTDYVPTVTGTFQPFYQNPPSLTQPKTGWQAQLLLTWMLYDGGLRYGVERDHRLLAHEADLSLEGTQRQARSEVRGGEEAVRATEAAVSAAREAARLAHEQLDLANLSYKAGATTNLDVIDAERTALDADTQAEVAEDNVRQARLDLLAASGQFP